MNSSKETAISITNTMIGSSIIVLPVLFLQNGVLLSVLILCVLCLVQFKTCHLLVARLRPEQTDLSETIDRVLGRRWSKGNLLANVLLLYIVGVVYFQLIAQLFYPIMSQIIKSFDKDFFAPERTEIVFGSFSYQWSGILMMAFQISLFLLPSIQPLLQILKYSFVCPLVYFVYLLTMFSIALANGEIVLSSVKLFSEDFSDVAGTFALSFLIHSVISPIIKNNSDQEHNARDLFLGYLLTGFVYLYIGIVGGLSCGANIEKAAGFQNVFECYGESVITLLVEILVLFQLSSVLPVLHSSTKQQFFMLAEKAPTPATGRLFSIVHAVIILAVQISGVNVSAVISFDGAIVGFFIVYLIPVALHFKAESNREKETLIETREGIQEQEKEQEEEKEDSAFNSIVCTYFVYGTVLLLGVCLGVFKVIKYF